ncbi:MAG: XdhC/CoxI family protein [Candidatus Obscuribacterales bacterium]|nr:XdhC/CoxI family protein [Candidatus Obscuribacterales bacterium]
MPAIKELRAIINAYNEAQSRAELSALATVDSVTGSAYRRPGARMLVTANGETFGSVSGGCLERDVIEQCLKLIDASNNSIAAAPQILEYDTSHDDDIVLGSGTGCPGMIRISIELIEANSKPECISKVEHEIALAPILFVFGAGHDAPALAELAQSVGMQVSVFDHRKAFADESRFPKGTTVTHYRPEDLESWPIVSDHSCCVVMAHNFLVDKQVLSVLLESNCQYLGAMGPKRRTERILNELKQEGKTFDKSAMQKLHAPIGLDIGAESPDQIALSILAEIQAVANNRQAGFLRNRTQAIHDSTQAAKDSTKAAQDSTTAIQDSSKVLPDITQANQNVSNNVLKKDLEQCPTSH